MPSPRGERREDRATSTGLVTAAVRASPATSAGGREASAAVSRTARRAPSATCRARRHGAGIPSPAVQIRTTVISAGRQRPCLVGADDCRGPQRLDRRQPAHERMPARHAPHAHRQRDRGYRRQRFRHRRDRQGDARLQHVGPRRTVDCRLQPRPHRRSPIVSHASRRPSASSRRSSGVGSSSIALTSVPIRPSSVCCRSRRRRRSPVPLATVVPMIGHVRAIGHLRIRGQRRRSVFSAGIDSPVKAASSVLRSMASSESDIGRHAVAGVELHDVARHERLGRHHLQPAVAYRPAHAPPPAAATPPSRGGRAIRWQIRAPR